MRAVRSLHTQLSFRTLLKGLNRIDGELVESG
jgi:hypothetical protein